MINVNSLKAFQIKINILVQKRKTSFFSLDHALSVIILAMPTTRKYEEFILWHIGVPLFIITMMSYPSGVKFNFSAGQIAVIFSTDGPNRSFSCRGPVGGGDPRCPPDPKHPGASVTDALARHGGECVGSASTRAAEWGV